VCLCVLACCIVQEEANLARARASAATERELHAAAERAEATTRACAAEAAIEAATVAADARATARIAAVQWHRALTLWPHLRTARRCGAGLH
jgi:hypothetical protein